MRALLLTLALLLGLLLLLVVRPQGDHAPDLRVAVASNFSETATLLADRFRAETGLEVELIVGSSGKHAAQIEQGAPYDLFLSADSLRPWRLEQSGIGIAGSRWTYARGRLAAWSPGEEGPGPREFIRDGRGRIALANPKLAPYGVAAETLLDGWHSSQVRVMGENVSQAFQFAVSGHADVALVSLAQARALGQGRIWEVPDSLYPPIVQQGLLVSGRVEAARFRDFLMQEAQRALIRQAGYLP